MPQITIDLDIQQNKEVEIFKAENCLKNKADAVKMIISEYIKFKNKKNK